MRRVVVVVILCASAIASAEPASPIAAQPPRRDPATALWMSLGTSAAGLALVLVGADVGIRPQAYPHTGWLEAPLAGVGGAALLVGPSLGSFYADRLWNGRLAVRLVGLGVAALAFAPGLQGNGGTTSPLPVLLLAAGGVLYLAGATYEIATTPRAVDRYNREHGWFATPTLSVSRLRDRTIAQGLAIARQF